MLIPLVFSQYQGSFVLGQQDPKYVPSSHKNWWIKEYKKVHYSYYKSIRYRVTCSCQIITGSTVPLHSPLTDPTSCPREVWWVPGLSRQGENTVIKNTRIVFRRRGWAGMWVDRVCLCAITTCPRGQLPLAWSYLFPVPGSVSPVPGRVSAATTRGCDLCPPPSMLQSPARSRGLSPVLAPVHSKMVLQSSDRILQPVRV